MRKYLVLLVAALALVVFTMPAQAVDIKASGFYRSFFTLSNFHDGAGGPSLRDGVAEAEQTNAYVAQRFRIKWTVGSENVKAVWYLESDMNWGDSAGSTDAAATRNSGGALGADKVQTETKQINVWFKIPDTPMEATVGLQGIGDDYAGVFGATNDMAGVKIKGKYEPVSYYAVWAKLYENEYRKTDDATLYMASVNFNPNKESQLGINFYVLQDDTGADATEDTTSRRLRPGSAPDVTSPYADMTQDRKLLIYQPGVDGSIKVGPAKISGFFFYQFGKAKAASAAPANTPDIDVSGFAADLRGDMNIGPGKVFLEGLYISGDNNENDDNYDSIITLGDFQRNASPGGYEGFSRTHMVMLLPTWNMASISQCFIGCSGGWAGDSLGNGGRGAWVIAAGYNQKFTDMLTGEVNVGYLAASDLYSFDESIGRDKDMGTEVNATVTANIQKGLTVSLTGAYAWVGDFMKNESDPATTPVTAGSETFKDAWTSYVRVAYKY